MLLILLVSLSTIEPALTTILPSTENDATAAAEIVEDEFSPSPPPQAPSKDITKTIPQYLYDLWLSMLTQLAIIEGPLDCRVIDSRESGQQGKD